MPMWQVVLMLPLCLVWPGWPGCHLVVVVVLVAALAAVLALEDLPLTAAKSTNCFGWSWFLPVHHLRLLGHFLPSPLRLQSLLSPSFRRWRRWWSRCHCHCHWEQHQYQHQLQHQQSQQRRRWRHQPQMQGQMPLRMLMQRQLLWQTPSQGQM